MSLKSSSLVDEQSLKLLTRSATIKDEQRLAEVNQLLGEVAIVKANEKQTPTKCNNTIAAFVIETKQQDEGITVCKFTIAGHCSLRWHRPRRSQRSKRLQVQLVTNC